jgi:hypothetical protein
MSQEFKSKRAVILSEVWPFLGQTESKRLLFGTSTHATNFGFTERTLAAGKPGA